MTRVEERFQESTSRGLERDLPKLVVAAGC